MKAAGTALLLDDSSTRAAVRRQLESAGFGVIGSEDAETAWSHFISHEPAVVVVKLCSAHPERIQIIRRIRVEAASWIPVIVFTSESGDGVQGSVFAAGQQAATRLLQLPRDLDRFGRVARETTQQDVHHLREKRERRLYHDLLQTLQECDGVIARVADQLGEDRTTIYYRLKKFGLY